MVSRRSCDALVIGGGLAGLQAAEVLSQFVSSVVVVDKAAVGRAPASLADAGTFAAYLAQDAGGVADWKMSGVSLSEGGMAERLTPFQKGFYAYRREIMDHGGGLCDPLMADFTAAGIYNRIGWLESYGRIVASRVPATALTVSFCWKRRRKKSSTVFVAAQNRSV
jgi:succinate dehydrogenase/fumarate reductase flavoprotein subunit